MPSLLRRHDTPDSLHDVLADQIAPYFDAREDPQTLGSLEEGQQVQNEHSRTSPAYDAHERRPIAKQYLLGLPA